MEAAGLNLGPSMRRLLDGRDGPRTGIALGGGSMMKAFFRAFEPQVHRRSLRGCFRDPQQLSQKDPRALSCSA